MREKKQKGFRINAVDDDATGDDWIEANSEWKGVHRRRCMGCRSEERRGPGQMSAQRVAWWASGQVSMRGDFCRIDGVTARDSGEKNRRRRRGIHSNSDQTKGVSEWWRRGSHYSRRANGEADGDAGGSRFGFPSLATRCCGTLMT